MATFLVTGGTGFIGGHLVEALIARGHTARVFDNLSTGNPDTIAGLADLVIGDIRDAAAVVQAMEGVDGVFHLAAIASTQAYLADWAAATAVNAQGGLHVFEAAARAGLPVVYASSAAVYGEPETLPLTEMSRTRPLSGYGADKLGLDQHRLAMADMLGLAATGLRFFNVYGPRQLRGSPYSGVITAFLDRWEAGEPWTVFGDGGQTRDFVYVGDVADALCRAMDRVRLGEAGVYNVCSGQPTSILGLIDAMAEALGARPDVRHGPPRPGEIRASLGDPTAAARALGFRATTPLATGIGAILADLANARRVRDITALETKVNASATTGRVMTIDPADRRDTGAERRRKGIA